MDLGTAPLPALIALVRSIDSDLADRATTERWDRDRLLITMRDEALPLPQRVDAPVAAAAPAALGPPISDENASRTRSRMESRSRMENDSGCSEDYA